ncbi:abortive infection family protein [Leeia sp. TBRC 13508]|uniref:Abortive infection family protein n=1 Tax=Leeia speluncae TaxID=2884804 RepID=A0ABS8D4B7_9NEIS|nr:abortive infection family protein [Leeia speluncae]MCB6182493.1 abortive infection family protein [Leeia speluncae]
MALINFLLDSKFEGKLILALQRAVHSEFTESDWIEIGYQTGEHEYIQSHNRLLRSLHFGDEDYGASIFQVLKYLSMHNPDAIQVIIDNTKVNRILQRDAPDLLFELGANVDHVPTVLTKSLLATEVVERALADADSLLKTSGPISCVDRLHTALHGYIRALCTEAGIPDLEGASITTLFKKLRSSHLSFQHLGTRDNEIVRILNGFGTVIDAINTIRNNATVAHPNDSLLSEAEATLAINVIRTLFHYISAKVDQ